MHILTNYGTLKEYNSIYNLVLNTLSICKI